VAAGRGRSRRVSLPGVAELLRPATPGPDGGDLRLASGREKHTQKITVYLSAEELLDLERARLALLRYGAAADRGRIVREAIAVLLADLDARACWPGASSPPTRPRTPRARLASTPPPAGPPKKPANHRSARPRAGTALPS
jgi:hypothetical protein